MPSKLIVNNFKNDVVILGHHSMEAAGPQPLYLAKALARTGLRVTLISRASNSFAKKNSEPNLRFLTPVGGQLNGRASIAGLYLQGFWQSIRARIVINFDLVTLPALVAACRLRKIPAVLYFLDVFYTPEYLARPTISSRLGIATLKKICPPDALIDVIRERIPLSMDLCQHPVNNFVIRNVPLLNSDFNMGIPALRKGLKTKLVYAGSVVGETVEGVEQLLRAMSQSQSNAVLSIYPAGGREKAEWVSTMISKLGLSERVQLMDRVERFDLPRTLAQHDVGIVLYPVNDGQSMNAILAAPNKLYEYLACGLAIIASNNPTLTFIGDRGLGWSMSTGSELELAKILEFADDRAAVDIYRQSAYKFFLEEGHYEHDVEPFTNWVKSILD